MEKAEASSVLFTQEAGAVSVVNLIKWQIQDRDINIRGVEAFNIHNIRQIKRYLSHDYNPCWSVDKLKCHL